MRRVTRRRLLELGAAGTVAALGGCLGGGGDGEPTYTDWIPASDGRLRVAYADLAVSRDASSIDPLLPLALPSDGGSEPAQFAPQLSGVDDLTDPMLGLPLRTGRSILAAAALSIAVAGLEALVDPAASTGITELYFVDETAVGTGEIDTERAHESLRAGTEGPFGELRFEVVDDGGEYTTYEPAGEPTAAVAVSDSAVLVADTRERVRAVADAHSGDRTRAVEADGDVEWLFDAAGAGDLVVGWEGPARLEDVTWGDGETGPAAEVDPVLQRSDVVSTVTFSPEDGEVTAGFALRNPDLGAAAGDRLAARLGESGEDRSVTREDDRLSATATYADDVLDVELVENDRTTRQTTVPGGDDVPPAVASAVPEGAFEFSYDEDKRVLRVNFVEEFEADRVTVTAVESGNEASTSTPGPVTYLSVFVGAEDDVVVVTATVDGETGVVARWELP